ncbi:hypothetical protein ACHQM5_002864 [Ranunculus cassubicifolius]
MEIAIEAFNNASVDKNNLVLHVKDSGGKLLQASTAANELMKEEQVEAIVGMGTWEEAVLVADVFDKAEVPILSFATPSLTPQLTSTRWPFLVRMAHNDSLQMQCIASIVGSYGWHRVIVIYEDDGYNADSRVLALLTDELQKVGTEVEHWLALPPITTLPNPKAHIHKKLKKLNSMQSRVFIIVGSSLELSSHIATEGKDIGLMGDNSVWITTDSVANLFQSVDSSFMSSMQGFIGIKTHFSTTNPFFLNFSTQFRNKSQSTYPNKEDKYEPGINALRAYDAISTIALALERSAKKHIPTTSKVLLGNILSSNFSGLSEDIQFKNGELSTTVQYEIVNVRGPRQGYNILKYWSPEYGFANHTNDEMTTQGKNITSDARGKGYSTDVLGSRVRWPGGLKGVPKGWEMPSEEKQMKIGVPGRTSIKTFVSVENGRDPTGFCIDVFKEALKLLNYKLPHKFVPFNGSYNDLVNKVYAKEYDAAVGDFTILLNRSKYVDFTQPYAESGLTMMIPVKTKDIAWLFVKPFTMRLWLAVGLVFVYTMFVVWFLEHRSNPDFRGPWKNQLGTAMWFTFSTLFFAHRETLRSNYTRLVMFVWLFTVFVVTASYTASLTSMLTLQRREPTAIDIETLKRTDAHIGCDRDSFLGTYLVQVLGFHRNKIINITSEKEYPEAFRNGKIKAAFLELPYERVLLSKYPKEYKDAGLKHRFGGLAFVFPKGSPMSRDFSEAFLYMSECGTLNNLTKKWLASSSSDSNAEESMGNQSLGLSYFWLLFVVTGGTSTCMLVLYIILLCTRFRRRTLPPVDNDNSVWIGIRRLGTYYNNYTPHERNQNQDTHRSSGIGEMMPSDGESSQEYITPRTNWQPNPVTGVETHERFIGDWGNQERPLRLANSFPGPDRRLHDFNYVPSRTQRTKHSTPF